jgi:DNA polymerase
MLVAEAPGKVEEEHREPQPLVGPAGRRLNMILAKVPLDRAELWLSNVAKCRPPSNDLRPYPNTVILCPQLWLDGEIQIVQPAVILALGATAGARWFPGYQASEMADMQRVLPDGRVVCGAFHPSYGLRRGGDWNSIDESIRKSLLRAKELANA